MRVTCSTGNRQCSLWPGPSISLSDLPADITQQYREAGGGDAAADRTLRGCIGRYARLILDQCQGNKRRACEILDISYHTLNTYLEYERERDPVQPLSSSRTGTQDVTTGILCEQAG